MLGSGRLVDDSIGRTRHQWLDMVNWVCRFCKSRTTAGTSSGIFSQLLAISP